MLDNLNGVDGPAKRRTLSSGSKVSTIRKLSEWTQLFISFMRERSIFARRDFVWLLDDVIHYDNYARRWVGRPLVNCRVLEIGFGARPYRLFALHAFGIDVLGVDLDQPVSRVRDVMATLRANGFERALKSVIRYVLFDLAENGQLSQTLARASGRPFKAPMDRLVVADAADPEFWQKHPGPYDFVYAEDVFEHIPRSDLPVLVALIADHLADEGIAVIRPLIWTGIKGGHHVEYYGYRGGAEAVTVPPWDHLRGRRFPANTYLNELSRRDYLQIFREKFDIVEEIVLQPNLGRELLTSELRAELNAYDDYELFSNKMSFVLRRKQSICGS